MTNNIKMSTERTIYRLEPAKHISRAGMPTASDLYPLGRPISWVDVALLMTIFSLMAFGLVWAIGMLAVI